MLYAIVAAIVGGIFVLHYYIFSHWKRHGFPYLTPTVFVGNLWPVVSGKSSFGFNIFDLHKKSTEAFIGVYLFFRPALLVRDPVLINRILTTDFNSFHDRGVYSRPHEDPISDNIFAMEGKRWRDLRAKFTPIFTTGRLKNMLPTMCEKGDQLQRLVQPIAAKNKSIELKDLTTRYGLDVIASVFFGLDVDTLSDPDHTFRTIETLTRSSQGFTQNIIPVMSFLCPK